MRAAPAPLSAPTEAAPRDAGRSAPAKRARPADAYKPAAPLFRAPEAITDPAIGRVLRYHRELGWDRRSLVGYVMDLGYDWGTVITNDYYKVRVGGLPKNCFLLIRPGSLTALIRPDDAEADEQPAAAPEPAIVQPDFSPDNLFDLIASPRSRPAKAVPQQAPHSADQAPHLILARVLEPA